MPTLIPRLVLSGHPYSYQRVRGEMEIRGELGGDEGTEQGPWKYGEKLSSSCSDLRTLLPFPSCFMEQQHCPPYPPPREQLLPQDIPEMHSRGVGQLRGGGGMEDKRSNPSKEWNVSVPGVKNLGYMENIVRADTHKGSYGKTGSYREGRGREKAEDKVRSMRVGGVTLALLPNLASESATAVEGGVVGETDISGLGLLEAHLGLDWAAEGLDPISLSIAPHCLHPNCAFSFSLPAPGLCPERFSTKLLTLSPHMLSQTRSPYTDPIMTTLSSCKDPIPHTQLPHKHTSISKPTTCPNLSPPLTQTFSFHSCNKHF